MSETIAVSVAKEVDNEVHTKPPSRHKFIRLMSYVAKYWHLFLFGLGLIAVGSYLKAVPGLMTRDVLNVLTPPIDANKVFAILPQACLIIVGASITNSVLNFVQRYSQSYISQKVVYDLRNGLFNALTEKSFSFYDRSRVGDIVSRVTSDVDRVQMMTSTWFNELASIVAQFAIWIGILFSINASMTLMCLGATPIILLITSRYSRLSGPIFTEQRKVFSDFNTFLQQNIVGTRVVRIFGQEEDEKERFSKVNEDYFKLQLRMVRIRAFYPGLNTLVMGMVTALIYWFGGGLIIGTYGTPAEFRWGDLVIFVQGMASLMAPLRFLSTIANTYNEAMAASARIFEILDAKPDIKDRPDAIPLPSVKGEVVFENISFGYDSNKPVLKNIDLKVKPGETIAILGPTGSGKSTLLFMIPRFYDVTSGRLLIDGHDVRDVQLKSLREQIGIALQESFLFSATLKENIKYGRPEATDEEVVKAAQAAQIHDFIMSLPDGYETYVGERGITLSGGQKQRLTIARTLLKDPKILIFDDTTSFVDTETEHRIQQAMEALLKDRTAFIVTQRLSTIKGADEIIVLREGSIVEKGTHEALLADNGIYTAIYQTQFAPREEILARGIGGGK